jgi:hypothetical protein
MQLVSQQQPGVIASTCTCLGMHDSEYVHTYAYELGCTKTRAGVEIPEDTPVIEGLLMAQAHAYAHSSSSSSGPSSSSVSSALQPTSRADLWGTVHTVEYDLVPRSSPSMAAQIDLDVSAAAKSWSGGKPWVLYRAASVMEKGDAKDSSHQKDRSGLDAVEVPKDTRNMLKLCK